MLIPVKNTTRVQKIRKRLFYRTKVAKRVSVYEIKSLNLNICVLESYDILRNVNSEVYKILKVEHCFDFFKLKTNTLFVEGLGLIENCE